MMQLGKKTTIAIASSLVLFGAVLAGVAIASGEEFAPVPAPQWEAGYSFSYDVTGHVDAVTDGSVAQEFGVPGDVSFDIPAFGVKKEILSTEYDDVDGSPVYLSAATYPLSNIQSGMLHLAGIDGSQAYLSAERQSDLAPLAVVPDTDCTSDDCDGKGVQFVAGSPMSYLPFPLTPEKRMEQEVDLPFPVPLEELEGVQRMYVVSEVTGMESIDLGDAGVVDAVRVDISYTPIGLQEQLAVFAQAAEDAGLTLERFNVQLSMHEIVHYAPELEAIVGHEYVMGTFVDIAAHGEVYGQQIDEEIYAEVTARLGAVLTGIDREAGPERTPTEILSMVGDPRLIADARGQGVGASPYTVDLFSSHGHINAAEDEPVVFGLAVEGIDSLPEEATIRYEIDRLGDHDAYDSGFANGDGFLYQFGEPGVYDVTVFVDDGESVKQDTTRVVAFWHEVVDADCSVNLIGSTCGLHEFDVAPGANMVEITAHVNMNGVGGPLLGDYSYVSGSEESVMEAGNHIALDALEIQELGYGEWSYSYENQGDHLADGEYEILVYYGAPEPQEPEPEGDAGASGGGDPRNAMAGLLSDLDGVLSDL